MMMFLIHGTRAKVALARFEATGASPDERERRKLTEDAEQLEAAAARCRACLAAAPLPVKPKRRTAMKRARAK